MARTRTRRIASVRLTFTPEEIAAGKAEMAALEKLQALLGPRYIEGALMPPPGISAKHYLLALAETVGVTELSDLAWAVAYVAFARALRQAGKLPMPFGEP